MAKIPPIPEHRMKEIALALTDIEGGLAQINYGNAQELVSKLAYDHAKSICKGRKSILRKIEEAGENMIVDIRNDVCMEPDK